MKYLMILLMCLLPIVGSSQWNNVVVNQVGVTATNDSVNLNTKTCSWWLMDHNTSSRIGPIYEREMVSNSLETSWSGYYNLQNIDLLRAGTIHKDSIYELCAECAGTDTLAVMLDPIGSDAVIDVEFKTSPHMGIDSSWYAKGGPFKAYFVDYLVWDTTLRAATNIQNTLWSGQAYNHANFNYINHTNFAPDKEWSYIYPRNYIIIQAVSPGGFINYRVIERVTGVIVYKEDEPVIRRKELRKFVKYE